MSSVDWQIIFALVRKAALADVQPRFALALVSTGRNEVQLTFTEKSDLRQKEGFSV